ncbi:MAG: site-specific DNA-methyltransferase [Abditibacteriota bacterium]|nr:site-specific DNA-methyltransferase [Abditibacteriota bacterium]
MKSPRNKTIDIPLEEGGKLLNRCLIVKRKSSMERVENKIIYGDMFDVCKRLPPESVDLLMADPPYNMDKSFGGEKFSGMRTDDYAKYTERWIKAVKPLLKPTASIYVCGDWKSGPIVSIVLAKHFKLRNRITWQREKGRGASKNWKSGMEDIYFATVSDDYTFNLDAVKIRKRVLAPYKSEGVPKDWTETKDGKFRDTCPSNLWDDICVPYWSMPENTAHPTQKPEKLAAKIILASSNPGDVVFDPFVGSGTAAVVAKKLDRRFIAVEKNPQYCVWAQKRLENADESATVQGYEGGVFWERNVRPVFDRDDEDK